jgi:hypothetical protein
MSSNKKIVNATRNTYDGICFKSLLEKVVYSTLSQLGYNPQYEPQTFTLFEGFVPITPFYDKMSDSKAKKALLKYKMLELKSGKIIGIKYTPDFYFRYKDIDIYIEAKGMENDVFYIKKKLFIKFLDERFTHTGQKSMYFEIYNKRQLLQALEIIKDYGKDSSR